MEVNEQTGDWYIVSRVVVVNIVSLPVAARSNVAVLSGVCVLDTLSIYVQREQQVEVEARLNVLRDLSRCVCMHAQSVHTNDHVCGNM